MRQSFLEMMEYGPRGAISLLLFVCLWPASCLYRIIVTIRVQLYQHGFKSVYRASVPVISVGNITTGGTGKTPIVDFLTKYALSKGQRVAIVSRGYGGSYSSVIGQVNSPEGGMLMMAAECGDEPFLLAKRNPEAMVFVARRRRHGVSEAEQAGADLILLDDGFQHLAVYRDLDIVLLDANRPLGNGYLLPIGCLREPVASLQRSDLLVGTRSDNGLSAAFPKGKAAISCRHVLSDELVSLSGEVSTSEELAEKRCVAFAGIARPEAFFTLLKRRGFNLVDAITLSDHQEYTAQTLSLLQQACHNADIMITTEKDAVKLAEAEFTVPCYYAPLTLEFDDKEVLELALDDLIRSKQNAPC